MCNRVRALNVARTAQTVACRAAALLAISSATTYAGDARAAEPEVEGAKPATDAASEGSAPTPWELRERRRRDLVQAASEAKKREEAEAAAARAAVDEWYRVESDRVSAARGGASALLAIGTLSALTSVVGLAASGFGYDANPKDAGEQEAIGVLVIGSAALAAVLLPCGFALWAPTEPARPSWRSYGRAATPRRVQIAPRGLQLRF
jgi:hypothetical protein